MTSPQFKSLYNNLERNNNEYKKPKKITFISIFIISSSCAEESPQLDAYLYRVFDNYPCCKVKDNCQKLYYNRYIQLQYVLKNETSDTLFLPINIV